eukprot:3470617-Rhodomonas_salina.1
MLDSVIDAIVSVDGGVHADRLKVVSADGAHASIIWQAGDSSPAIASARAQIRKSTAKTVKDMKDKQDGELGVSLPQRIKEALYSEFALELKEYHQKSTSSFRDATRKDLPQTSNLRQGEDAAPVSDTAKQQTIIRDYVRTVQTRARLEGEYTSTASDPQPEHEVFEAAAEELVNQAKAALIEHDEGCCSD